MNDILSENRRNFRGYLYDILQVLLRNYFLIKHLQYMPTFFSELIKIGLSANNTMLIHKFHSYKISQSNSFINSIIEQLPCTR